MQWALRNPNLYLDQPITKTWCQPIGGHVSNPTDCLIATRLGLCSSLEAQLGQDPFQYKDFDFYFTSVLFRIQLTSSGVKAVKQILT